MSLSRVPDNVPWRRNIAKKEMLFFTVSRLFRLFLSGRRRISRWISSREGCFLIATKKVTFEWRVEKKGSWVKYRATGCIAMLEYKYIIFSASNNVSCGCSELWIVGNESWWSFYSVFARASNFYLGRNFIRTYRVGRIKYKLACEYNGWNIYLGTRSVDQGIWETEL